VRHLYQQQNEPSNVTAVDPRTRLLAAFLLLALVVSSHGSIFPWQVAGICLPVALISGMQLRMLLLRMLHPLFIAIVILTLKTFMGAGESVTLFKVGSFSLVGQIAGFREGLLITSRIIGAVSVAVLLSQVMTFTETMAALA
jgi:cobalt/nickel transport system permease protein